MNTILILILIFPLRNIFFSLIFSLKECRDGTCVDPCLGFDECGTNAICVPVNHLPTCKCPEGYKVTIHTGWSFEVMIKSSPCIYWSKFRSESNCFRSSTLRMMRVWWPRLTSLCSSVSRTVIVDEECVTGDSAGHHEHTVYTPVT